MIRPGSFNNLESDVSSYNPLDDPLNETKVKNMYENGDYPYLFSMYIDPANVANGANFISDKNINNDKYDLYTVRKSVIAFADRLYNISMQTNKKPILPNGYMGSTTIQVVNNTFKNIHFALIKADIVFSSGSSKYDINIKSTEPVNLEKPYYIICCGYNPKYTDLPNF